MQNLAEQAEVSIGTIYRYFENKEVLLNELQKFICTESAQEVFEGWDANLSDKQKYDLVWQNIFNFVIENPKRLTLLEMLHYVPNIDQTELTLFENETFKLLIDFYQEGIDSGRFINWQLFALIAASIETAVALAKQVIRGRVTLDQEQQDQVKNVSWNIIQNQHLNQQD
ncbi:TetR/AcrR family transcriptional regulator [Psychromonas sp. GE-S-Ul-11]